MHLAENLCSFERLGEIEEYIGQKLTSNGPPEAFVGELCEILDHQKNIILQAQVIGFKDNKVHLMPFSDARISPGCKVRAKGQEIKIPVGYDMLGQVVDALGFSMEISPPRHPETYLPVTLKKINPLHRKSVTKQLITGIHAIDLFLPLGKGQRTGLFAGSGVGKSTLLNMMAKNIQSDINIIGFIGERGREVQDFIEKMDEGTRAKTIVVAACSDESALMRKQAVYTATALAGYFCRQGEDVMLFMDSITRFAMAQREIGLSLGEPPTARGYPPTSFSLLPGLIEQAGNFSTGGSITALYTVLVEGDDLNDPVADTLRSLLDGHIVLNRELAHQGHYPPVDILQSVSRLATQLTSKDDQIWIKKAKNALSLYHQNKDLIELGAYQSGQNLALDNAIEKIQPLNDILKQSSDKPLHYPTLIQRIRDLYHE